MRQHLRGVLLERFVWCGLKGKTRPGDAHPYLVSFYLLLFFSSVAMASGRK